MRIGKLTRWVMWIWVAIAAAVAAPAIAAPTITVTATGDIDHQGGASFGNFPGSPNPVDLANASTVQIVHTFVENPGDVTPGDPAIGLFSLVSVSIAIDGEPAVVFDGANADTVFAVYQLATLSGLTATSLVESLINLSGLGPDDQFLDTAISIGSDTAPVVTSTSLHQNLSFFSAPSPGSWSMGASLSDSNFATLWAVVGDVESITVVVTGLSVPEVGTLWVAVLALSLLMIQLRRRQAGSRS